MNGDRESLAEALRGHSLVSSDRVKGTIDCRCGWSGPYLSRHQADTLAPVVDGIAEKRARDRAVDELREAVADLHYDIGGEGYADRTVVTLGAVLDRLTTRADALEAE